MKTQAGWMMAVFAALALPAQADIVPKSVKSANGKVATGYVLQGSYKMRGLGKRKVSVSAVPSVRVITDSGVAVSTQAVIPVLQNTQLKAKPRFGYGSDFGDSKKGNSSPPRNVSPTVPVVPQAAPTTVIRAQPIYTYSYRPREYYPSWGGRVHYGYGGWNGSVRVHGGVCPPSVRLSYRNSPFAFSLGW